METDNYYAIKNILHEFKKYDPALATKAIYLLSELGSEMKKMENELVDPASEEMESLINDEIEERLESKFVGLDTIQYRLVKGNLKIKMQMDSFIESLQTQNAASIA